MFTSIFNSVVEKLSGLNPIKTFIKYALDRFLNELINNEIKLQDFKNGCLNLTQIGFNIQNVNKKHLLTSPYILHSGLIGNLKILLPALSQMGTKSIEIQVKNITLQLKPNKDFYKNFKLRMKQLQQNITFQYQQSLPEQQLSENNPMDFFKETLKQILLNIKIRVQNITVKLYMNDPDGRNKDEMFYLMIKIPVINVKKSNELKGKVKKNLQEIKLDIQMPQLTVHLMKDCQQTKRTNNQIPNIVYSPSTILLFGLSNFQSLNIQTDKSIPRLTLSVTTNYKQKKKFINISAITQKIQVMVNPLQIKILSRFLSQLKQFKNIFSFVKNQLNLGHHVSQDMSTLKRVKSGQSKNEDIFSSICMSMIEPEGNALSNKKKSDIIDVMIKESSDLQNSVRNFNLEFKKQLQKQGSKSKQSQQQLSTELRIVNFQKQAQINLEVNSFYIYILKQTNETNIYQRLWLDESENSKINTKVPCSYFMFSLESTSLNLKQNFKMLTIQISKLKLQNIKLYQNVERLKPQKGSEYLSIRNSFGEDNFFDVHSSNSEMFKSCIRQSFGDEDKLLKMEQNTVKQHCAFVLTEDSHYCIEQIVRVSQKPSQNIYTKQLRKYNFLPKPHQSDQFDEVIYKPGIKFTLNSTKPLPVIKIDIMQIAISLNSQLIKQLIQIAYPMQQLQLLCSNSMEIERIQTPEQKSSKNQNGLQQSLLEKAKNSFKKRSLLESQYNFGTQFEAVQQFIEKKQKPLIQLTVKEINLAVFEEKIEDFTDLIQKNGKLNHFCSFQHSYKCFCNLSKKGFYFETFGIQMEYKDENLKLSLKRILSGSIQLQNSRIHRIKALLSISSKKSQKPLHFIVQKSHPHQINNISIFLPQLSVQLSQVQILQSMLLIKNQLQIAQNLLFYYQHRQSLLTQQLSFTFDSHRSKRQKPTVSYEMSIQMYLQSAHLTILTSQILIKHLYLNKASDQLNVKFSTLVFALIENCQLFLNQMKNQQLCLREYIEKNRRYPYDIKDSNIILEIHDQTYKPETFKPKNPKDFFQKLSKTKGCFMLHISKTSFNNVTQPSTQTISYGSNSISSSLTRKQPLSKQDKFKFTKKPSLRQTAESVIAEQEQFKKIILNVSSPVYMQLNNLFRLMEQRESIKNFLQKVNSIKEQIVLQSQIFSKPQRKHSTDSDIQKLEQVNIAISTGKLNIDIRPTFCEKLNRQQLSQNNNQKSQQKRKLQKNKGIHHDVDREIIFGSTRSYLQLQWENMSITIQKRIEKLCMKSNFSIRFHFLEHQQRQLITNPVFLTEKQLSILCFLPILQIKSLKLELELVKQQCRLKPQITSLVYESSWSTLSYLKLHLQHFVNHNIKREFGLLAKQQEEKFCALEDSSFEDEKKKKKPNSEEQFEKINLEEEMENMDMKKNNIPGKSKEYVEDLTKGFEVYVKKAQRKKQLQEQFKAKTFTDIKQDAATQLFIEELKIKELKVKIYSGNDFEFISLDSINESRQKKRLRINDIQKLKYIELRIDILSVSFKSNPSKNSLIQLLLKLENLELNYSYTKPQQSNIRNFFTGKNGSKIKGVPSEQILFPLIRNQGTIKVLAEISDEKVYVKLGKTGWELGFTSQILDIVEQIKKVEQRIKISGWKKVYPDKITPKSENPLKTSQTNPKLLLIYLPQTRLTLHLIYKSLSLLQNQSLTASQLLLHEQLSHLQRINDIILEWVKNLVYDNLGGLISGTTMNFFGDLVGQILKLVKFILGIIFRNDEKNQYEIEQL